MDSDSIHPSSSPPPSNIPRKHVHFATSNSNKLSEVQSILEPFGIFLHAAKIDISEIQADDPQYIARQKSIEAFSKVGAPVITEDTCLCTNALNGLPGPYIKWFLKAVGPEGIKKLLNGFEDQSGYALCIFCYYDGIDVKLFEGKCTGRLVTPRGPQEFGWDCIFEPEGFHRTFAELPKEIKNHISHRRKALDKLMEFFAKNKD